MPDGKRSPRQTVILAAGNGQRLGTLGQGLPKPLLQVGGRPLIEHALDQAVAAGCEEAIIVVGHQAEQLEERLARIATPLRLRIAHNPNYHLPNGMSLLAAEPYVEERFFLQMADHVFKEPVLERLTDPALDGAARLLVDHAPRDLDEADATKVRIREGLVTAIGKELSPYDAVDAGCFLLDRRVFDALHAVRGEAASVSAGMERLAAAQALAPVRLEGVVWVDVDTPADWDRAEALLQR
ncbi:MAG TPA: NTP transferase domain-containing protein [Gemmatimonadales bacterium]|nr:NTP transferase domain-containing protein [Gemmatimonadales bacterium]